jgi:hypothetical protein
MTKTVETVSRRDRPRIKVTQTDIDKAVKSNSAKCVVAQAIARQIPDATRIEVDTQTVRFTSDGRRWAWLTPYAVQGYVIAFDAGDEIEPFEFSLTTNIQTQRRGRTAAGKKVAAAGARVRKAKKDQEKGSKQAVSSPPTTMAEAESQELVDARAAYESAKAEAKGHQQETREPGARRPPKRVFKTKQRTYGHRQLRINQIDGMNGPEVANG